MGSQNNYVQQSPSDAPATADVIPGAPAIWQNAIRDLERLVSPTDFERYISELKCIAEYKGDIVLAARSRLTADRVAGEHRRLIQRTWKQHDPKGRHVRLIAWDRDHAKFSDLVDDPWAETRADTGSTATDQVQTTVTGERAGLTFDTLVVSDCNQTAYDVVRHVAEGRELPGRVIFIHGLQGVGKTHLITALQQDIELSDDGRSVVYTTAEDFQNDYIAGAMARDTRALKSRLSSGDVVMIEDLQTIADAKGTDAEFCRNLRAITGAGGLVLITADAAPSALDGFSSRVVSQLRGAMSVEVKAPDKDTRRAIVARRAQSLEATAPAFRVDEAMIEEICARVRGQGRELCGALLSLYSEAGLGKLTPTTDMLARVLDRQAGKRRPPTIDLIKRATTRLFDVTKVELEGPRKMQRIVYPRHLAMYLCREMTDKSFPTIARSFGKRDHTSIMYASQRTEHYLSTRDDTAHHLDQLRELIYDMQA